MKHTIILALKMEEGTTSQGMWEAPRSWKRVFPEPLKESCVGTLLSGLR